MNIKLSVCLVAISSILYGCSTISTPDSVFDSVVAPNTIENDNKVVGDGSHLKLLPMSRDFLMDSPDNFQAVVTPAVKSVQLNLGDFNYAA